MQPIMGGLEGVLDELGAGWAQVCSSLPVQAWVDV